MYASLTGIMQTNVSAMRPAVAAQADLISDQQNGPRWTNST